MQYSILPRVTVPRTKSLFAALVACAGVSLFASPAARATSSTLTIVKNFTGKIPPGEEGAIMPVTPPFKASDGNYYGIAAIGGTFGNGFVFKVTAAGVYSVLHNFHDDENSSPLIEEGNAPRVLIQGADGNLYGVCSSGGRNDDSVNHNGGGTIFKITLGGTYTKLHDFDLGDPNIAPIKPVALIQGSDNNFYGLTFYGGKNTNAAGVFFRFNASTKVFTELHDFTNTTSVGIEPNAQLLDGKDGFFYGTTSNGGGTDPQARANGTIFKIQTSGKVALVHPFQSDPENPDAQPPQPDTTPLILGKDGFLYGASYYGGNDDYGTLYRCSVGGGVFSLLHSFGGQTDGGYPFGGLTQAADGNFYGGLQYGFGTTPDHEQLGGFFLFNATTRKISIFRKFSAGNENNPFEGASALTEISKGTFYGETSGGTGEIGTLVKLVVSPAVTSATTATATVGKAFTYHIVGTNTPTSYAATGLPAGLSVNTTNGTISGTPTKAGTSTVTISAKNAAGAGTATLTLTVKAAAPDPVVPGKDGDEVGAE